MGMHLLLKAVLIGAAGMWSLTLVAGLVLTVQAWLRDSFSIATAASACAFIHVLIAAQTRVVQVVYLPAALAVLVLATIAGTRSLLRLEPG
jgi:hypothetical protein